MLRGVDARRRPEEEPLDIGRGGGLQEMCVDEHRQHARGLVALDEPHAAHVRGEVVDASRAGHGLWRTRPARGDRRVRLSASANTWCHSDCRLDVHRAHGLAARQQVLDEMAADEAARACYEGQVAHGARGYRHASGEKRGQQLARHDLLHGLRPVRASRLGRALAVGAGALVRHVEGRPDRRGERRRIDPLGHEPVVQPAREPQPLVGAARRARWRAGRRRRAPRAAPGPSPPSARRGRTRARGAARRGTPRRAPCRAARASPARACPSGAGGSAPSRGRARTRPAARPRRPPRPSRPRGSSSPFAFGSGTYATASCSRSAGRRAPTTGRSAATRRSGAPLRPAAPRRRRR